MRTHTCGELSTKNINQIVTLCGWIDIIRNKKNSCFIDLRDRYGITQIFIKQENLEPEIAKFKPEYVIQVTGQVIGRTAKQIINKNKIPDIEIIPTKPIILINKSLEPKFNIENQTKTTEETRLQYRYLDLRRTPMQNNLIFRHKLLLFIRNYLDKKNYLEIETPILVKPSAGGAREFLVPSRIEPNSYYTLAQSPQIFKQLLMVGNLDKYFQVARCFRDEELRSDRQPEFTQLDLELSFTNQEFIMAEIEQLFCELVSNSKSIKLDKIPIITYSEAIKYYGTDKPDLRYDLKFVEFNIPKKGFYYLDEAELIIGFKISGMVISNSQIYKLLSIADNKLLWIKYLEDKIEGSIDKYYSQDELKLILEIISPQPGDLIFLMAGPSDNTRLELGKFRILAAREFKLINKNLLKPLWVIDFPLFEQDGISTQWKSCHHPFTAPHELDLELLNNNQIKNIRAQAYDLVLNGYEIGGGSIRIHNKNLQNKIFQILGLSDNQIEDLFGYFLKAFDYGICPHGGFAFGLDRLCCVLNGDENIRDYIAFPKNSQGKDMLMAAPCQINKLTN